MSLWPSALDGGLAVTFVEQLGGEERALTGLGVGKLDLSPGSALLSKSLFFWTSVSISVVGVIMILMTTTRRTAATTETEHDNSDPPHLYTIAFSSHSSSHWTPKANACQTGWARFGSPIMQIGTFFFTDCLLREFLRLSNCRAGISSQGLLSSSHARWFHGPPGPG